MGGLLRDFKRRQSQIFDSNGPVERGLSGLQANVYQAQKPSRDKDGYLVVHLRRKGVHEAWKVHQLVLAAFVGPCPEGQVVRHKNAVRDDNRLENLEYGTSKDNAQDRVRHGNQPKVKGESNPQAKLNEQQVREIRSLLGTMPQKDIAKKFGVSRMTITVIKQRKVWSHVTV